MRDQADERRDEGRLDARVAQGAAQLPDADPHGDRDEREEGLLLDEQRARR